MGKKMESPYKQTTPTMWNNNVQTAFLKLHTEDFISSKSSEDRLSIIIRHFSIGYVSALNLNVR